MFYHTFFLQATGVTGLDTCKQTKAEGGEGWVSPLKKQNLWQQSFFSENVE